jgi:hypothetical protein
MLMHALHEAGVLYILFTFMCHSHVWRILAEAQDTQKHVDYQAQGLFCPTCKPLTCLQDSPR